MANTVFLNGHALLIGVGDDLAVTVKDATALQELLIDKNRAAYPPEQVELLTEAKADRQGILDAFDRLIDRVANDQEATVLVYFSGHGGRVEHSGIPNEYYLVPYGYNPDQRAETAVSGQEFTSRIKDIQARKLIVLLDCCHAGGMPKVAKEPGDKFVKSPFIPELLETLESGSGRIFIASSHEEELSWTGEPYSIFTTCLVEALEGKATVNQDGFARILDTLIYLYAQVPKRTSDKQHPFVNWMYGLDENFALCYYAGGSKSIPGKELMPEPVKPFGPLTRGQRQRLQDKLDIYKLERGLRVDKIKEITRSLAIQPSSAAAERFKLTQDLLQEQARVSELGDKMEKIERELQH